MWRVKYSTRWLRWTTWVFVGSVSRAISYLTFVITLVTMYGPLRSSHNFWDFPNGMLWFSKKTFCPFRNGLASLYLFLWDKERCLASRTFRSTLRYIFLNWVSRLSNSIELFEDHYLSMHEWLVSLFTLCVCDLVKIDKVRTDINPCRLELGPISEKLVFEV